MNVNETSQQLMLSMTSQQIENALRKAQTPRKTRKSHENGARGKGKKKRLTQNAGVVNKNTRPLNSYMAFRSKFILSSAKEVTDISRLLLHHLLKRSAKGDFGVRDLHVASRSFQGQMDNSS